MNVDVTEATHGAASDLNNESALIAGDVNNEDARRTSGLKSDHNQQETKFLDDQEVRASKT